MKRILTIRSSAIGDVVMASPLLPALRRAYPAAHLAWLVEPYAYDLLRHNPLLDAVIVWPKGYWKQLIKDKNWRELAREVKRFAAQLRQEHFDLVLDGQGLLARFRYRMFDRVIAIANGIQKVLLTEGVPSEKIVGGVFRRV